MKFRDDLFDKSEEYDGALQKGLRFSGEERAFFLRGRVAHLRRRLPGGFAPRRILDFGCGLGDTAVELAGVFPTAHVLGVDTAPAAIEHATREHASERVSFALLEEARGASGFDLGYTNGVFHHIAPGERGDVVAWLHGALAPGGRFALMENNPWNPGTRLVMAHIEFDRDAVPLSAPAARRLLREGGFAEVPPARFLFVFPRVLSALRFAESALERLPLGAQYCVLARKGR